MKQKLFFILLIILFNNNFAISQGCSDAGFCTIGSMKQNAENDSAKHHSLSVILTNGIGDEGVYVFTPGVQYDNQLNKHLSVQSKITANSASGNLGNATGLGDLIFSGSYSISKNSKWNKTFTAAFKVPLNNSNLKEEDKALPMGYQSSLGTLDFIAGFTITNNTWIFSTAYQQPISNPNGNTFLPEIWNTEDAYKFSPTIFFHRKADVLLKAGYNINFLKKLKINLGLLAIYHLANDTYTGMDVEQIELVGSDGLTLNATLNLIYKISNNFSFALTAGAPLTVRDIRPDGLTRSLVLSPELIFNF